MKNNKMISILICITLLLAPWFVFAEEEDPAISPSPTTSPEPSTSPEPTESPDPPTSPEPSPSPTPVEIKINLDTTKLNMNVGEKKTIKATVSGSNETVEWITGNASVASVVNGTITATGEGSTTITATVEGKKATCEVVVTKVTPKGTDATLKNVVIENGTLDKKFSSDVYEYTVTLTSGTSISLKSYAKTDNKAKVSEFKNDNSIKLVVTSEDEKKSNTYIFSIAKTEISLSLKSLKINGYDLNEEFSANKTKYTAIIPYDIDTLTVDAVPDADSSKVQVSISGTKNLKIGDNQIKITVKDNDGNQKVYEIIATRSEKSEIKEKPTSIITSGMFATSSANLDSVANSNGDFIKYFIVSLSSFILFAIGGIGVYFYIKTSPKKLRKELAKAKKTKEDNPMIVVGEEEKTTIKKQKKEMVEELMETKEFKKEDLLDKEDEKDV